MGSGPRQFLPGTVLDPALKLCISVRDNAALELLARKKGPKKNMIRMRIIWSSSHFCHVKNISPSLSVVR